jgi:hypothetical protein
MEHPLELQPWKTEDSQVQEVFGLQGAPALQPIPPWLACTIAQLVKVPEGKAWLVPLSCLGLVRPKLQLWPGRRRSIHVNCVAASVETTRVDYQATQVLAHPPFPTSRLPSSQTQGLMGPT